MRLHDNIAHQRDLEATLQAVLVLLSRQEVVSGLVEREAGPRRDLVQNLLQRQHSAELQRTLHRLHPADIAFVLENIPPDKRQMLWALLSDPERGTILLELADAVRENLIGSMSGKDILNLASHLDSSQIAELMPKLPEDLALDVLGALDRNKQSKVQSALSFPRGSVGALMEFNMVTVREDMSVDDVLNYLRKYEMLPATLDRVFVIDQGGILHGVLLMRDVIRSQPATAIRDLMDAEAVAFRTDDSAREAASAFERYDLLSAPVVNLHNQLVGVINIDRIMDFKDEVAQKDMLNQVGLREDEDLFAPVWNSARDRWIWLGLNLTTAFLASRVVALFEGSIAQVVTLAALMPIVASIGGNTGNQTVALMIRGIALRQITRQNFKRFVAKEMGIGLINGAVWGCVMAVVVFFIYFEGSLSMVMMLSMLASLFTAAMMGAFIPAALHLLGRDPVLGSSVLLTAVTDSLGFFIFLGTATLILF
ncbi:MAG: magnesium transporter [Gammaproteobacteria bacterium]|nr:magnesium transporter [Gammaproteobacteria bacterium]